VFRSSNPEHPGDKFYNTSVQVLSSLRHTTDNQQQPSELPLTADNFYVINQFNHDSGIAEGTPPAWLGPVDVLRLYVQHPSSSWAILNEVVDFVYCFTVQRMLSVSCSVGGLT